MDLYSQTNWAKNTYFKNKVLYPNNIDELKRILSIKKTNIGLCGNLRSFGDTCVNKKNLISLKKFPKKIHVDKKKSILNVTSNFLLKDILKLIIPMGFMISVTPGSKYVTIGGMIANNVFGKNSYKNQLKSIIDEFEILMPNNKIIFCSRKKNKKIFNLTVGGFGLTGVILSAKIKLKKIKNQFIEQKVYKFKNILQFKKITNRKSIFNVSWIDSHSLNKDEFKGLFYTGDYSKLNQKPEYFYYKNKKLGFWEEMFLSFYIKRSLFSKIINTLFFSFKSKNQRITFDEFFYPQDKWLNFNDCYKNGFFQIQFLVEEKKFDRIINKISEFFRKFSIKSTFIIIKKINEDGENMNYFGKGYSISMDFEKNSNFKIIKKFFNNLIFENGLKLNFSKDSIFNFKLLKYNREYKKFLKDIKSVDEKKVFKNEFSNRLKIKI